MRSEYNAPEAEPLRVGCAQLLAISATGEDYTDPEEYEGF